MSDIHPVGQPSNLEVILNFFLFLSFMTKLSNPIHFTFYIFQVYLRLPISSTSTTTLVCAAISLHLGLCSSCLTRILDPPHPCQSILLTAARVIFQKYKSDDDVMSSSPQTLNISNSLPSLSGKDKTLDLVSRSCGVWPPCFSF